MAGSRLCDFLAIRIHLTISWIKLFFSIRKKIKATSMLREEEGTCYEACSVSEV